MRALKGIGPKMIANNLEPYEPIHPGEMIKAEIEYRSISQKKLALQTGIWIKTQSDYDVITAKRNKSFAQRLENIRKIAAIL